MLRFYSTKLYTNIKVGNYSQQSYVVAKCIKILIYNNRSHKLFVNISRLHKHIVIHKHSRHDYTMCSSSYFIHKNLHTTRILCTGIPNPSVMLIRNRLTNNSYLVKVVIFQVTSETAALNTGATLLRKYSINLYIHTMCPLNNNISPEWNIFAKVYASKHFNKLS